MNKDQLIIKLQDVLRDVKIASEVEFEALKQELKISVKMNVADIKEDLKVAETRLNQIEKVEKIAKKLIKEIK